MKQKQSLAIFGEGITEWYYIDSLRIARRFPFKLHPSLPQHSDIKHMLAQAKKCIGEGYDEVVCLIDMDRLNAIPSEKQAYLKAKSQTAYRKVTFVETDPCTEYWFLMHFMPQLSKRNFANYEAVELELRKHMPGYEKAETYLRRIHLYDFLCQNGNLEQALTFAKRSADLHDEGNENSYSQMYKLFEKLEIFDKKTRK